jgi:hypothetical protein
MSKDVNTLWQEYDESEKAVAKAKKDQEDALTRRSEAIQVLMEVKGGAKKLRHPDGRGLTAVNRNGRFYFRGVGEKEEEFV